MELWIRSQDKESLRRINTSLYLKQGLSNYAEGDVIFIVSGGDELGEYKTKERALEVLDEIQEHIEKQGEDYLLTNENGIITGQKHYGLVYEMPSE